MLFDAVIFDFDGVLVESEPMHEWAIRESLRERGWSFSCDQFYHEIVGRGDHNAYRRIAEWNGGSLSDDQISALLKVKWELMHRGIHERRFHVQPGAAELVRQASAQMPTAVCSGSVGETVKPMLATIGLLECFRAIVTGEQVKMKPDPEGYLTAAKRLGVEPSRCLAIEDTPTGIKAAKAAGMFVIGVGHTVPLEMLHEADQVVVRIGDVTLSNARQG